MLGFLVYTLKWGLMFKNLILTSLFFPLFAIPSFGAKEMDLAGTWYNANPDKLRAELNGYLTNAKINKINGDTIAFIVPHAGLRFSGEIAAYTYKTLSEQKPEVIILAAFSHKTHFDGIAILDDDSCNTPFGPIKIEKNLVQEFKKYNNKIISYPVAFKDENSIELQFPFIKIVLPDTKLVVFAFGSHEYKDIEVLSDTLYNVLKNKKNYVILASTDMSHFLPYKEAVRVDNITLSYLKELDAEKLYRVSEFNNHGLLCGFTPVCAAISAAKKLGANEVKILKYANSGDTSGMKDSVVGYVSAAFLKTDKSAEKKTENTSRTRAEIKKDTTMNTEQKKKLLEIARNSLKYYLETGKKLEINIEDKLLLKELGAFVTLHKYGQLRGCIGHITAQGPLYLTVRDMAIAAGTTDPRFSPVRIQEMDSIDIEISVLSQPEKIKDYKKIEMGNHGVIVQQGFKSGVYLPQVATETGWSREEFMNSLCAHKTGIESNAWKTGACDIYIFTAEVFGEKINE
ncbi:dioxygenase [Candidatus Omnitrophus magneticus]|uniref:Dioxygenase n=1 Tax=Candidatus Omnitrophus magneticus TaxID=1609969 RepID=A0A0F0CW91_9BACT|nr:dioxygenase [Candidatus Omnitrophus magneticus]